MPPTASHSQNKNNLFPYFLLHITPLNIQNSPQAITSQHMSLNMLLGSCTAAILPLAYTFGNLRLCFWSKQLSSIFQIYIFHNISPKIINLSLNKLKLLAQYAPLVSLMVDGTLFFLLCVILPLCSL